MSRSSNTRKGRKNGRSHSRKGCDYCLHLRRHMLIAEVVRKESPLETVTGAERWYEWEGGFLLCG